MGCGLITSAQPSTVAIPESVERVLRPAQLTRGEGA